MGSQVELNRTWAIYKLGWSECSSFEVWREAKSDTEKLLIKIQAHRSIIFQKFLYFREDNLLLYSFVRRASLISLKLKKMLFIQVSYYTA